MTVREFGSVFRLVLEVGRAGGGIDVDGCNVGVRGREGGGDGGFCVSSCGVDGVSLTTMFTDSIVLEISLVSCKGAPTSSSWS